MTTALGLSSYKWNNNIKSMLLLAAFPFLLLGLLGGIFFLYGMVCQTPDGYVNPLIFQQFGVDGAARQRFNLGFTPLGFAASILYGWWPMVAGAAAIWCLIGYAFNDSIIHMATGARPVERRDAPELYNTLENLCISRGMKTPPLYIIETEEMNAYASGINEGSYAITVTRGCLNNLNHNEIEAVLGHELTHIINRDCRLLIISIVFVGMISFMAQMLWRSLRFVSYGRGDSRRGGGGILILLLIAGVVSFIGYLLALVLRFALSRRREYLADAGSVELTKDPEALISALKKISHACDVPHVPSEVRQMFIENPPSIFDAGGLFATHPPIEDRIQVLERLGNLPAEGRSLIPPSQ